MKRLLLSLFLAAAGVSASAMNYADAREYAYFLTDKMAYELNLTLAQYDQDAIVISATMTSVIFSMIGSMRVMLARIISAARFRGRDLPSSSTSTRVIPTATASSSIGLRCM